MKLSAPQKMTYPPVSMAAILMLTYLAPFTGFVTAYAAFAICLYRLVRFDAGVFGVDYCVLLPVSTLLRTADGMQLLVYLCLLAVLWQLIRGGIKGSGSFVLLLALLNYFVTRMQLNFSHFLLCFGQLALLWVLLPKQDGDSAQMAAKAFCVNLLVSSLYAFVLRDTPQMYLVRGTEATAIWGTDIKRFQGLLGDPNYYMTLLITGLSLLFKMRDCDIIRRRSLLLGGGSMAAFGILTYSKTFFILLVLLLAFRVLRQFSKGKYLKGVLLSVFGIIAAMWILAGDNTPLAILLDRFGAAASLESLTTGRTEIYKAYWREIFSTFQFALFGKGMAAEALPKHPHNLLLEITYYVGLVGLALVLLFCAALLRELRQRVPPAAKQSFLQKYELLFLLALAYTALHGMYQLVSYGEFFLALLAMLLTKQKGGEAP